MLPLRPLRFSIVENSNHRVFKGVKILRFVDLAHLEMDNDNMEHIFRRRMRSFMILTKQKRCGTAVRSFSTRFPAEISAVCQKAQNLIFWEETVFGRNKLLQGPTCKKNVNTSSQSAKVLQTCYPICKHINPIFNKPANMSP